MSRMLRVSEESGLAGAWDCSGAGRALPGGRSVVDHLAPSLQGVITVKGLVDREKGDFYTLTVVADDGGPKVDSTVVSRSPGKNPVVHSSPPQVTFKLTSSPATQNAGGQEFQ